MCFATNTPPNVIHTFTFVKASHQPTSLCIQNGTHYLFDILVLDLISFLYYHKKLVLSIFNILQSIYSVSTFNKFVGACPKGIPAV